MVPFLRPTINSPIHHTHNQPLFTHHRIFSEIFYRLMLRENLSWDFVWWGEVKTENERIIPSHYVTIKICWWWHWKFIEVLIEEFRNILIQGHIGHRKAAINMHWQRKVMNFTLLFINVNISIHITVHWWLARKTNEPNFYFYYIPPISSKNS